jgi:threonine/homoserine/homoserine lactone efflux protein
MSESAALLGFCLALMAGAMSPGPSFLMVARISVSRSRAAGLQAALGMGCGGLVFGLAALLGFKALLTAVPALYIAIKLLGGGYLAYLGYRIIRSAGGPLHENPEEPGAGKASPPFLLGLATQVSNPKTAIVYASLIATFIPPNPSPSFSVALLLAVFSIEAGWYALVAFVLSSQRAKAVYLSAKRWIDRGCGAVLGCLGLRLALSGLE